MNQSQRNALTFGMLVVIGLCLCPPYQWRDTTYLVNRSSSVPHEAETQIIDIGHRWIWDAPAGWETRFSYTERKSRIAAIDWPRLGIYVGLAAIVALFLAFVAFPNRKPL